LDWSHPKDWCPLDERQHRGSLPSPPVASLLQGAGDFLGFNMIFMPMKTCQNDVKHDTKIEDSCISRPNKYGIFMVV
jgi:hypothetical protein